MLVGLSQIPVGNRIKNFCPYANALIIRQNNKPVDPLACSPFPHYRVADCRKESNVSTIFQSSLETSRVVAEFPAQIVIFAILVPFPPSTRFDANVNFWAGGK